MSSNQEVMPLQEKINSLGTDDMQILQQTLEKMYLSKVDSALIAAICSDSPSIETAKETLDLIANDPSTSHSLDLKQASKKDEDKVHFLKESFPDMSDLTILHVLTKYGGNVEAASDHLLNLSFIDEEEREDSHLSGKRNTIDDFFIDDRVSITSSGKKKKRKKYRNNHNGAIGPLLNDIHQSQNQKPFTPLSVWKVGESAESLLLARISGLEYAYVHKKYIHLGMSFTSTLDSIARKDLNSSSPSKDTIQSLSERYPMIPHDALESVYMLSKGDENVQIQLIDGIRKEKAKAEISSVELLLRSHATSSQRSSSLPPQQRLTQRSKVDREYINQMEETYREKRDAAYREAARLFRENGNNKQAGAYFASLGRDYDIRLRAWKARDPDIIKIPSALPDRIDLHGLTVVEAVKAVSDITRQWIAYLRSTDEKLGHQGLEIITGYGSHGTGNAKIKPAIVKYLNDNNYKYEENIGNIIIRGKR